MKTKLERKLGKEVREVMDEHDNDPEDSFVKHLVRLILHQIVLGEVLLCKFEQVADKLIVKIPVLILLKQGRHEILITDQLNPSKRKIRIEERIYFVELLRQNVIEGCHLILMKIVLSSSRIAN